MTRKQRRSQYYALAIGAITTLLVCGAYLTGQLERIELMTLDWRFRTVGQIPQSPKITCIDIDDGSIDLQGRWPWHRDVQAYLLKLLGELGARAILVDLTWSEAEGRRLRANPYADLLESPFAPQDQSEPILPDYVLRESIASAGNVFLAYHYKARDLERSAQFVSAYRALQLGDHAGAESALRELIALRKTWPIKDDAPPQLEDWLARADLTATLVANPAVLPDQLVRDGLGEAFVQRYYLRSLRAALRAYVQAWFSEDPTRLRSNHRENIPTLYARLTDRPFEDDTSLKEALLVSYREALSAHATERGSLPVPQGAEPFAAPVEGVVPVYYLHARAAADCGFVVFEPDVDGVMRRMRLIVKTGNRVLGQLAFQVACEVLGVTLADLRWEADAVVLPTAEGERRLQLDPQGRVLVPWVAPPPAQSEDDNSSFVRLFKHIPAARLLDLARLEDRYEQNDRVIRDTLERICAAEGIIPGAGEYAARLSAWKNGRLQLRQAELALLEIPATFRQELDTLRAALDTHEQSTQRFIEEQLTALAKANPEEMTDEQFLLSGSLPGLQQQLDAVQLQRDINAQIERELTSKRERLKQQIDGQVCLIGYTATSLADMAPLPTDKRAPGVSAHANLINGLLVNRALGWTGPVVNVLLTLLCGAVISLLCALRSSRESVGYTLATLAAILVFGYWLPFRYADLWVTVTPPILAVVLSFAAISAFFYIFVDRERRQLSTALGQYTSQAIARQVAEDPELCQRAEVREVTSIFTDLKGFTSISERIGASRTQSVLNACLGRFTEVMLLHDAMVNKFMGDGIFAFWNPVINPQEDHAYRACDTALDLLVALQSLKEENQASGEDAFADLHLRVGIATGNAVVGPCGSDQKWDYTCIGDSVNLAARLESANKFFGTQILVGGQAREQVGDAFVFRALGGVQVKGKTEAVPIYELLGRPNAVDAEVLAYAATFAEGVAHFQQRDWSAAEQVFGNCATQRPEDLATKAYLDTIAQLRENPPGEAWNGSIELQEK